MSFCVARFWGPLPPWGGLLERRVPHGACFGRFFCFCGLKRAWNRFRDTEGLYGPAGRFLWGLWRGENRGLGLADQACSEPVQRVRGVKPVFLPGSVSPVGV